MRAGVPALLFIMLVAGCGSSEPAPEPDAGTAPVATSSSPPTTTTTTPTTTTPTATTTTPKVFVAETGELALGPAVSQIARAAGVNVVLNPDVTSTTPVDAEVRKQANATGSWRGALDLVAASAGCEVQEGLHGVYEVANHTRVDVAIDDLPARTALRLIAAFGGQSLVIERSIPDEPLDLTLDGMKWRVALDSVVASLGPFQVVKDGDVLRSQPRADAGPQKNQSETDTQLTLVAGAVVSATSTKLQLQPDKPGDPVLTLWIPTDESAQARRIRDLLANMDERAPRVAVTASQNLAITNVVVRSGRGAPR
jgi:hypothetical protein